MKITIAPTNTAIPSTLLTPARWDGTATASFDPSQFLRNYNNELVKSIEDLREKREELNRQILKDHGPTGGFMTNNMLMARYALAKGRGSFSTVFVLEK